MDDLYFVVRNTEGHYSVWFDGRNLPAGWETVGEPASKQACLQQIERLWTEAAAASGREHPGQDSGAEADPAVQAGRYPASGPNTSSEQSATRRSVAAELPVAR
ncbi:MbtH family NRPS accessory protein [Burkholderia gladioli]|uniref:MbtH family NRPS accessory protein n=1 Tax=Burkholderia gladioli TaxID=28095 RepID=UPI001FC882A0|nr:MbtH family NRPS accessory protein [Burkholderia gladioli]